MVFPVDQYLEGIEECPHFPTAFCAVGEGVKVVSLYVVIGGLNLKCLSSILRFRIEVLVH